MIPGEIITPEEAQPLEANHGLRTLMIREQPWRSPDSGRKPRIFSRSTDMDFDRQGGSLNVPAGTAARFEPEIPVR